MPSKGFGAGTVEGCPWGGMEKTGKDREKVPSSQLPVPSWQLAVGQLANLDCGLQTADCPLCTTI